MATIVIKHLDHDRVITGRSVLMRFQNRARSSRGHKLFELFIAPLNARLQLFIRGRAVISRIRVIGSHSQSTSHHCRCWSSRGIRDYRSDVVDSYRSATVVGAETMIVDRAGDQVIIAYLWIWRIILI